MPRPVRKRQSDRGSRGCCQRNKGNVEMKERGRERLADVMRRGEGVRRLALPLLPSALTAALGNSQANTNSFPPAACPQSLKSPHSSCLGSKKHLYLSYYTVAIKPFLKEVSDLTMKSCRSELSAQLV
ncbi:hypothetical protein mRhiFer1_008162 [Rhinolophus ferrumequinum]|uniref:Uncharacterized protein n=1 Tax=Rhinolophus ferrumequinum TaxID=59479 RepID=A0A7J7W7J6_RHIFE|nr:hypothetical protein mRhiFer1_008162 [Rhinolophus ferrumequinum]